MRTIYRYRLAIGLLSAAIFLPLITWGLDSAPQIQDAVPETTAINSPEPLSGTIEMSLDHDEASGTWVVHLNGTFAGEGAAVTAMSLFGTDASGTVISSQALDSNPESPLPTLSPFTQTIQIPKPDPDWSEAGVGLTVTSNGHSLTVRSSLFPIIWHQPILIDHAIEGAILSAPNYAHGDIPDGVGISHTLINGVPEGDYYAVVFFDGLNGCPSDNYEINAFRANAYWGYDIRGPNAPFAKAKGTLGGGCMQKFHIDPAKNDDWLWGALSNTGTSSAIADLHNIPAFAICATATACDPIIPHAAMSAPEDESSTTAPVSDILFLPGIKGSKLYEDNPLCLIPSDSCGIPLWLPLADATVPELFLDNEGKSEKNIFVRDSVLLGSAFGQSFYDSFTHTLDQAKSDGAFGKEWNWKAVAYDWRLSLPDIIHSGLERGSRIYYGESTSTPYISQELKKLAAESPSGKVTIIAHSNGGLVAKALIASLGDTLAAQLIDTVIFVGVPQSGAPRALGALLYGDAEGIPGIPRLPNFIMSAAHAREFALNSPMAYHLLPSAAYIAAKQPMHPIVQFEQGDLLAKERAAYGSTIDTGKELRSFALAEDGDRSMPSTNDLSSANILTAGLLSYAETEHDAIDAWQPPPGIEAYQLGGYGVTTISGIDLYEEPHAHGSSTLSYRPLFTPDGDGTVPIISSLLMNASAHVHQLWLDLSNMRNGAASYSHGTMLEAPDLQQTIVALLHGSNVFPATVHAMDIPETSKKQLAFYAHSPISLAVTDANGSESSVNEETTKESIPNSVAGMFGEVKYVLVPANSAPYTVTLAGESNGTATFDMQELDDGVVAASSTIADMPVTRSMHATLTIGDSLPSASALVVDEDGDGSMEYSIEPVLGSTVFPRAPIPHSTKIRSKRATLPRASFASTTPVPAIPYVKEMHPAAPQSHVPHSELTQATAPVPKLAVVASNQSLPLIRDIHPAIYERLFLFVKEIIRALWHFLRMPVDRQVS
ncbi:MAG TPA: hypothetical protein VN086_01030 [Candidatus Paceibacterota bacterium]|nr:hypothetical protein [Candidatus Paceibacterota bacterium]